MNRKILMSLGVVIFVAALSLTATGAFFSDEETSTGNTFTAGSIDLTVDSEQHYNNAVCVENPDATVGNYYWQLDGDAPLEVPQYPVIGSACDGTWLPANLGAHKFFNFGDIKPGDEGENTISLHVGTNDAYACVDVTITKNDDVSTVDPETDAGDQVEDLNNNFDGELAQNLNFFAWKDDGTTDEWQCVGVPGECTADPQEGDNIWQAGESPLFSNIIGPASDALNGKHYTLANSQTGPLVASTTSYIGLTWCAGTLTTTAGSPPLVCDGAGMGNLAQTDTMVADIAFRVEQSRNNGEFTCDGSRPTTLTLAKAVIPPAAGQDSAYTLTATGATPGITGTEGQPAVTNVSVTPGVYALSEVGPIGGILSQVWECSGNATAEISNGDGTGSVTIAAGESVVCGITNTFPLTP